MHDHHDHDSSKNHDHHSHGHHHHPHGHSHEHAHGQGDPHVHAHGRGHGNEHHHEHTPGLPGGLGHSHGHDHARSQVRGNILVLRPYTGISGDIMVAGLARMLDADKEMLEAHVASLGLPALAGSVCIVPHSVNEVSGWRCAVSLPHEHSHRTLADIKTILAASSMSDNAKALAESAFTILAEAEGAVHGKDADTVSFHEVGALDSILDTCLAAALFDSLSPSLFVCGPLPVCDGTVHCAHGKIPVPAPAVLKMLHGIPVKGIPTSGETITPTGLALLKAFGASFGTWPALKIQNEAIVYGTRVFENVANGAVFAFGQTP